MKKLALIGGLSVLAVSCLSGSTVSQRDVVVEELRSAVADARHSQAVYQTELELLDDKLDQQRAATEEVASAIHRHVEGELSVLELKVSVMEKEQDKLLQEIALFRRQAEEQSSELAKEMRGIKGVLELAMGDQTYEVCYGDSLGEIAQRFGTDVTHLKELNQLSEDKIFSGQLLKVPTQSRT